MKQDMDDSSVADLHAYVCEELLSEPRRAPRRIPAGISGTEEYVRVEHRQRYDYMRGVSFTERCEWKITRKLGIDAIDRGRVPFDVTLALRAPEMSEEDAMIARIDGDDGYEFVCNGFYDDWSHDYEEMVRELVYASMPDFIRVFADATGEDVERDEDDDDPRPEVEKTSEVKRQRNWERRMLLKRRVRRYARHTGAPKRTKYHAKAA